MQQPGTDRGTTWHPAGHHRAVSACVLLCCFLFACLFIFCAYDFTGNCFGQNHNVIMNTMTSSLLSHPPTNTLLYIIISHFLWRSFHSLYASLATRYMLFKPVYFLASPDTWTLTKYKRYRRGSRNSPSWHACEYRLLPVCIVYRRTHAPINNSRKLDIYELENNFAAKAVPNSVT